MRFEPAERLNLITIEENPAIEPNAAQVAYWNGPGGDRWAELWQLIDGAMAAITAEALAVAAPRPGERVLDVGCGAGTTALALREGVGASGAVTGVDISAPMLAVARGRGAAAGAGAAVTFVEADAAAHLFRSEHDLVFSRFGVMFFADPVAAFANLRRAAAPGGRLAFVCWRAIEDNAWVTVPLGAARALLPDLPPPAEGAPGPFAFADRDRVREILDGAGWREIEIERRDQPMALGATIEQAVRYLLMIGPVARGIAEVGEEARGQIRARVAEALAAFAAPAGVAVPSSCWMVTARA
jgi:SAM-dependent methyltransferase